jgi:hypothetical protein
MSDRKLDNKKSLIFILAAVFLLSFALFSCSKNNGSDGGLSGSINGRGFYKPNFALSPTHPTDFSGGGGAAVLPGGGISTGGTFQLSQVSSSGNYSSNQGGVSANYKVLSR